MNIFFNWWGVFKSLYRINYSRNKNGVRLSHADIINFFTLFTRRFLLFYYMYNLFNINYCRSRAWWYLGCSRSMRIMRVARCVAQVWHTQPLHASLLISHSATPPHYHMLQFHFMIGWQSRLSETALTWSNWWHNQLLITRWCVWQPYLIKKCGKSVYFYLHINSFFFFGPKKSRWE